MFPGSNSDNYVIEDCVFDLMNGENGMTISLLSALTATVRRCIFIGSRNSVGINISAASEQNYSGVDIENCLFIGGNVHIQTNRVYGLTINNCTFIGSCDSSIYNLTVLSGGSYYVYHCTFHGTDMYAIEADTSGDIVEDYNNFWGCWQDRLNVSTGSNSTAYPPIFDMPRLLDGFRLPQQFFGELSERSTLLLAGSGETASDLFGQTKPATAAKSAWGAIQPRNYVREGTTVYAGSSALKIPDAGDVSFFVPVDGTEITISVQVYREANYAGTNPRMIIKEPGQSDRTTTDAASSGQWNELTDTFTPNGGAGFVEVVLRSLNTATSGSYAVFFDDLKVA
jgi:hypothetical protein